MFNIAEVKKPEYPQWFRKDNGFRFLDPDGTLFIVMGPGRMRTHYHLGHLELDKPNELKKHLYGCRINKNALVAVCFREGEWHLLDLSLGVMTQEWWDNCTPFVEIEADVQSIPGN